MRDEPISLMFSKLVQPSEYFSVALSKKKVWTPLV